MSKRHGTVYVIDGDESVRKARKRFLMSADLDVETFFSAEEFLTHSRHDQSACILVDIPMPGLSGFDFQQRLLSQGVVLPVIAISASDDVKSYEHARELEAVCFFRKPVDDQALLDAIWWVLAGSKRSGCG